MQGSVDVSGGDKNGNFLFLAILFFTVVICSIVSSFIVSFMPLAYISSMFSDNEYGEICFVWSAGVAGCLLGVAAGTRIAFHRSVNILKISIFSALIFLIHLGMCWLSIKLYGAARGAVYLDILGDFLLGVSAAVFLAVLANKKAKLRGNWKN